MRLIGVTPSAWDNNGKVGLNCDYTEAILSAGGMPVILPPTRDESLLREVLARMDGLLLSGGGDVNPACYGAARSSLCGHSNALRDGMELTLTAAALERDMPLLAICRGIQILNTARGGRLYQDVAAEFGTALKHPDQEHAAEKVHDVYVERGCLLAKITGREILGVNSRHHQAISVPGSGLTVNARAADGLIEAVSMEDHHFVLGLQWHPESLCSYCEDAQTIFKAFVDACGKKS